MGKEVLVGRLHCERIVVFGDPPIFNPHESNSHDSWSTAPKIRDGFLVIDVFQLGKLNQLNLTLLASASFK